MRWLRRDGGSGVEVQARGTLAAPDGYDVLVSVGISNRGPTAIWSVTEGEAELHARYEQAPSGASFPVTQLAGSVRVAIASYDEAAGLRSVTPVPNLPVAHPMVDVLADGTFLVVGARCKWSPEGSELNALAIDQWGRIVRRGCLGDGIQHLQVGSDGMIWVGYSDEGVFGNFGWGGPGPTPLGAGGLAAWSPAFEKVWELDPQEGLIADCESLNVADGVVWCCPYTDFPVVRVSQRERTIFASTDVSGPTGIVVNGDFVALIGTYRDPSLLVFGTVRDGTFSETRRSNLRMPDGQPVMACPVTCRGTVAHFVTGQEWFSFELTTPTAI